VGDDGTQVQTWPHHLGTVVNTTTFLVACSDTVLAYGPGGLEIGVLE
jgi:hypothetical protein